MARRATTNPISRLSPDRRAAYARRLEEHIDITRLELARASPSLLARFLIHYLASEVGARLLCGIARGTAPQAALDAPERLNIRRIRTCLDALGVGPPPATLDWIFIGGASELEKLGLYKRMFSTARTPHVLRSARWLKADFLHDMGRERWLRIHSHGPELIEDMAHFLDALEAVLEQLREGEGPRQYTLAIEPGWEGQPCRP